MIGMIRHIDLEYVSQMNLAVTSDHQNQICGKTEKFDTVLCGDQCCLI